MGAIVLKQVKKKKKNNRHPLANTWYMMKGRCYNRANKSYKDYGGRGITICPKWFNSFKAFANDMGERPSPTHQMDRIDNNGNYCKENCRWATRSEQARNRRYNVDVTGVYKHSNGKHWIVYVGEKYIGLFLDYDKAVEVRKNYV